MQQDAALHHAWFCVDGRDKVDAFLRFWFLNFNASPTTARQAIARAGDNLNVILGVCPDYTDRPKPLGDWLSQHENRLLPMLRGGVVVFVKFTSCRKQNRETLWQLSETRLRLMDEVDDDMQAVA